MHTYTNPKQPQIYKQVHVIKYSNTISA